jgi:protein sidekick
VFLTFTVDYQPPPEETWNGHLMGYNIEYREVDSGLDWRSETLFNADLTSMTVYSLQLFKTYEFRIRAFNSLGQSDWSPQTVIYLEIGTLTFPPASVYLLRCALI